VWKNYVDCIKEYEELGQMFMGSQMLQKGHMYHVFTCSVDHWEEVKIHLLCSHSRVAQSNFTQVKTMCSGAVGRNDKILPVLKVEINTIYLWTESTIVLSWISSPASRRNTFVANREACIQETTNVSD